MRGISFVWLRCSRMRLFRANRNRLIQCMKSDRLTSLVMINMGTQRSDFQSSKSNIQASIPRIVFPASIIENRISRERRDKLATNQRTAIPFQKENNRAITPEISCSSPHPCRRTRLAPLRTLHVMQDRCHRRLAHEEQVYTPRTCTHGCIRRRQQSIIIGRYTAKLYMLHSLYTDQGSRE